MKMWKSTKIFWYTVVFVVEIKWSRQKLGIEQRSEYTTYTKSSNTLGNVTGSSLDHHGTWKQEINSSTL